jgi:hypothetical protein
MTTVSAVDDWVFRPAALRFLPPYFMAMFFTRITKPDGAGPSWLDFKRGHPLRGSHRLQKSSAVTMPRLLYDPPIRPPPPSSRLLDDVEGRQKREAYAAWVLGSFATEKDVPTPLPAGQTLWDAFVAWEGRPPTGKIADDTIWKCAQKVVENMRSRAASQKAIRRDGIARKRDARTAEGIAAKISADHHDVETTEMDGERTDGDDDDFGGAVFSFSDDPSAGGSALHGGAWDSEEMIGAIIDDDTVLRSTSSKDACVPAITCGSSAEALLLDLGNATAGYSSFGYCLLFV